ncbi:thiopeptide-type bacteriocin biosynthesis protein [Flavobacterium sp. CG_9.10]|uniref:thiopeptide-type bacteriocin biosynthesis protein n=1 Tax=Flavobacterium sp. CG_9.10 TaxID=2787729 RepID=UPI0018C9CE0E|nr:thiopeptide-type bacteriocin biosynthesis protein [Flavobacterium sp. CG_9.10]MBG6112000.1 thiopeptide-type bacteriocin biosynthesis protein [Flavobacterium sp. CG_9.10]
MKRIFCIGSEWLYYKIYTGVKTADLILLEKLYPVIVDLTAEKIIDQWFFIRYKDPDDHIRIRFNCKTPENTSNVIAKMYPVLNKLLVENSIWKIQTDTYQREIERYGENTMMDSEFLFWQDSEMIINYLKIKSDFINDEIQLLFSCYAIDTFLNSFSLTNADKLLLMDDLQLAFKKEFSADKVLKKEMDAHYRTLSRDIDLFITGKVQQHFVELFKIIEEKSKAIAAIAASIRVKVEIPLLDFLSSHIHMMVNRQFTSRQRHYELIIYDHLYRYYKTQEMKDKKRA